MQLFGTNQERIDRLNESAPGFFRILQGELLLTNVLHVARLTDPLESGGKKNLTIRNLAELVKDEKLKAELTELMKKVDESANFCRDWRNRRFGHLDLNLAIDVQAKPFHVQGRIVLNHPANDTLSIPKSAKSTTT